jgi:hypothetical protein
MGGIDIAAATPLSRRAHVAAAAAARRRRVMVAK